MNDNDIIKALECCVYGQDVCKNCHYNYSDDCQRTMMIDVLDLNSRQKAEVERLKHRKTELQIRNQELQHEKSEAVKEFAERVKLYIDVGHLRPPTEQCFSELDVDNMIDNLVKEMAGE